MQLNYAPYGLLLQHAFKLAHGSRSKTDTVAVSLAHEGLVGFGEAALPPYLGETSESVMQFLSRVDTFQIQLHDPEHTRNYIDSLSPTDNAAKAAIGIAYVDLLAKTRNVPSRSLFGITSDLTPTSAFTIGISELEELPAKLHQAAGFGIIKLKLGGSNDLELFNAVRQMTDKPLMIDANQGWKDAETALRMIDHFTGKNVLLVEQPLSIQTDPNDWYWLKERSPVPIFADESVKRLSDLSLAHDLFHGINIKLMKCTGVFEAFDMIGHCRKNGLKVMIGCMTESSCAIMAAAQLAPLADFADLDGPWLITNNYYETPELRSGKLLLPDASGHGSLPIPGLHPLL